MVLFEVDVCPALMQYCAGIVPVDKEVENEKIRGLNYSCCIGFFVFTR